jgi:ABC-2 type transport system ATP-binding protein
MSMVFRAEDLYKRYGKVRVLRGLDLEVPEGSVFGLIGSNGAGKTTTIKILMNILQASAGYAEVLGTDSSRLGPEQLMRIGYVSENQTMPGWMTVAYLLAYLKPFYPDWDSARAAELVKAFELPLDRKLSALSRGMLMKAALTASLAYRPRLLVLDEPFSGLDPLVREDLIAGLIDCALETTILISSHDLADIETFASHIGYLDHGRLAFSEEMPALSARFREIEVVVDADTDVRPAAEWPAEWLRRETSPAVVRFVDSHFDEERTVAHARRVFGEGAGMSVRPMPLRSIFVTLAKNTAKSE